MIDFTWKVFSQTGNVETYLLLKELETKSDLNGQIQQHEEDSSHPNSNQ